MSEPGNKVAVLDRNEFGPRYVAANDRRILNRRAWAAAREARLRYEAASRGRRRAFP